MHRLGTVALCGLLVLAGCSAVPGGSGSESTATLTPAPIPDRTDTSERLAPGLTSAGVTDPLALANAHANLGSDYRFEANWTVHHGNGSLYAHAEQETAVASENFHVRVAATGRPGFLTTGPLIDATFWSNGSVLAERIRRDGETRYRYLDSDRFNGGTGFYSSLRRPKPWRDHYALFEAMDTRVTDRRTGGEGPARYTVVGTRLRDPSTFAAATNVRRPGNVSLWAVIDGNGVVRSLQLSYEGRLPTGQRVHVSRQVHYRDIGAVGSIERPDWYTAALNGSRDSRGSIPNPRLAG
jgi:hypothetical protein